MLTPTPPQPERGTSLIEVLVTLLILAIGLLGVAGLQNKMGVSEVESYQREQALLALADMMDRIQANSPQAPSYVTNSPLGTGDSQPADCSTIAPGPALDQCQWSNLLKGSGEKSAGGSVGAMTGAIGCVSQVQAENPTLGYCVTGAYQVSVAWQGMTAEPAQRSLACGLGSYGTDQNGNSYRRVVVGTVTIPTTSCY